jgi:uncharacterized membrane protein (UPF0136 family)
MTELFIRDIILKKEAVKSVFVKERKFMKKYKIASALMFIHGAFMEVGGCLCLIPVFAVGSDKFDMNRYFTFIVPYLKENMNLMLVMGTIYGIVRMIGAVGLWKNKMWGLVLSVINCVITMALMPFMLPAGIIDGILAATALILILVQYFGNKKIIE